MSHVQTGVTQGVGDCASDTDLGVAVTLAVHRPEPNAYSFTDPFGMGDEEE